MREENIRTRLNMLLQTVQFNQANGHELFNGVLSLTSILHGPNSPQTQQLIKYHESVSGRFNGEGLESQLYRTARGALLNLNAEIDAGMVGTLQRAITGEVLTDFLQAARAALDENEKDSKNVAAVLTAALFEDTIRRLAAANGIPHIEKLQDVIIELKNKGLLQGSQVGIATAYLNFRNNALHAQWDKVEKESVASALSFVEHLLMKHFS